MDFTRPFTDSSFFLIAGPCVIEGRDHTLFLASELKKLAEDRRLIFDQEIMSFTMGNCIVLMDTNNNRKLAKLRREAKIDSVAAMMDAYISWKLNRDSFE